MKTDPRSDAELNRLIAEWKPGWTARFKSANGQRVGIHKFCTDLNAMHDAEGKLTDDEWLRCQFHLRNVLERSLSERRLATPREWWSATARQRAEALVKVIEEDTK